MQVFAEFFHWLLPPKNRCVFWVLPGCLNSATDNALKGSTSCVYETSELIPLTDGFTSDTAAAAAASEIELKVNLDICSLFHMIRTAAGIRLHTHMHSHTMIQSA